MRPTVFDPPDELRFGATQILPWLWLGGEEDVDEPLQEVDVWIDFRDDLVFNRRVEIPENILVIRMPFPDGDELKATQVLPLAKNMIDGFKKENKKILVSCHGGVSRSATLAWWILAEEKGFEESWCELKLKRPHIEPHENFGSIIQKIREYTLKR